MKIAVMCEESGTIRNELRSLGHQAWSIDLLPGDGSTYHRQGDLRTFLNDPWDMVIAFPPCTYLAKAQMHLYRGDPGRAQKRDEAVQLVQDIWDSPADRILIENPVGYLNNHWRKPNQIIYPWHFGDKYSKDICLWYRGIAPILPLISGPGDVALRRMQNHVNSRMSQAEKSVIKSSWKHFPNMSRELVRQITWGLET